MNFSICFYFYLFNYPSLSQASSFVVQKDSKDGTLKVPSRSFGYNLLHRHPELAAVTPLTLERQRKESSCLEIISPFFELFKRTVTEKGIHSDLIINIDETGMQFEASDAKVIIPAQSCLISSKLKQPRQKNSTLTLVVSLSGKAYIPQLIYNTSTIPAEVDTLKHNNIFVQCNGFG